MSKILLTEYIHHNAEALWQESLRFYPSITFKNVQHLMYLVV